MSIETTPTTQEKVVNEPVPTTDELDIIFNQPDSTAENAVEAPAVEKPVSRIAGLLQRGAELTGSLSGRLADSAENRQNAFEAQNAQRAIEDAQNEAYDSYAENINITASRERQEKIDAAKGVMKRFGRSALSLPRRTMLEARVQLAVGKEIVSDARDVVVDKAKQVKTSVTETVARTTDVVNGVIDDLTAEAIAVGTAVKNGVETAADYVNDKIDQGVDFLKGEYNAVKAAVAEKREALKNFFAERKAAALQRKEARAQRRAETRMINERTVNAEVADRLRARTARRTGQTVLSALGQERTL